MLPGEKADRGGKSKMIILDPGKEAISYKKIIGGRTYEIASVLSFAFIDKNVEKIDLELEFFGSSGEKPDWVSFGTILVAHFVFRIPTSKHIRGEFGTN
jgi:hypothetical protein